MHSMHQMVDRILEQSTSSGLFKNEYNIPAFSVFSMKKSQNESIEVDTYYWDGDWKRYDNNVPSQTTISNLHQKKVGDFVIKPSENSDGAIRTQYGDGFFNLYVSKDNPGIITIPHKHENLDEITYVTKGKVLSFVDERLSIINEGTHITMPKNKFHGFLPLSVPCEYLTMSVEDDADNTYSRNWREEINTLDLFDEKLKSGECELQEYKRIVEGLHSSVMEVRWHAEEILNKRLVQENNADNSYIRELVGTIIRPAIRSDKAEDHFFGLSVAYDLGVIISDEEIKKLLNTQSYMVTWVCSYYLMKLKREFNIMQTLEEVYRSEKSIVTKYYQCAILSILALILRHSGDQYKKYKELLFSAQAAHNLLPFDDILMYFVMWYTSFTYQDEELEFAKASERFNNIFGNDGESILRGFTNVQDHAERYKQINKCVSVNKLTEAACAFFESRSFLEMRDNNADRSTKERIKNYLRIIVSEDCNLKCVYCHHEGRISSLIGSNVKSNANFDLRVLLKKARELKFSKIKISGGEPLLYPNIISICNEFQNDFEDIGFTSNGSLIQDLASEFDSIKPSKLTFNITLNSLRPEINSAITGGNQLEATKAGIKYLVENGFRVKINSVITSYNFGEIVDLISYAARNRVNIKLLDLFAVEDTPPEFKHVSIVEIKNEVIKQFRLQESDFGRVDDYVTANVMGIKVLIPSRVYSIECQHNCQMYPCAEGIFGIRVYEDYSCAKCFKGTIFRGDIDKFDFNISQIRKELNSMRFSY